MPDTNIEFLATLESVIRQRLEEEPKGSYTAELVAQGDKRVAQKVGEEAIELALASAAGDREEQLAEAADLIYHLLVLLASKEIRLGEVAEKLEQRHRSVA
jgi:phosphoribosyl-ATP pyrophosphohydrolase/phosphoribosyl-AMP cyclohydrolase